MTYLQLQGLVNHLANLRNVVNAIVYPDADKETLKQEIIAITDQIVRVNIFVSFAPFQPDEYINYVMVLITWLDEIRLSHAYRLDDEMSYCITTLIQKWDSNYDQKIVVFTLGDYSVHKIKGNVNTHRIDFLLTLSQRTGVNLTKEPVFIRVPDEFKDHILANVVLFHEVGHIIDKINYVSEMVFNEIFPVLQRKRRCKLKREFFPRYEGKDINAIPEADVIVMSHIEEYIADVFGAQYAHEHILCYLSYLAAKSPNRDSKDHPSPNCRQAMVSSFIRRCGGRRVDNPLLDYIIHYLPNLSLVHSPYTEQDLIAPTLQFADENGMFGCFSKTWEIVLGNAKLAGIKREGKADYMRVLATQQYIDYNSNLRRAIGELKNRH